MKTFSIIVPCYNEEKSIPYFYSEIMKVSDELFGVHISEVIFIDDGSTDATLKIIKELSTANSVVKYISFSRNFGKESAIFAGIQKSTGELVTVMDVDLQDPPSLLQEMVDGILNEDFDCVATRRVTRKGEPPIRSFFARRFYGIINKISKTEFVDGARDFRVFTRQFADAVLQVKEYNRFSKGIFGWVGFKTKWLEYENINRIAGETKWSFWKLFTYSLDGIAAFSIAPLAVSSILGIVLCLISFILILFVVARTLIFGDPVAGYPSLICVVIFIGGIQLFCMGILGQYLSKTYLETKQRPIYITKDESK